MKAIQITVDEELLERLDHDPEVQRLGRSAVFRRAVDVYLRHRGKAAVTEAYRRAYADSGAGTELADWADEGTWPER